MKVSYSIIRKICRAHQTTPEIVIKRESKKQNVIQARYVTMLYMHEVLEMSPLDIAYKLKCTRKNVYDGLNKARSYARFNKSFQQVLSKLNLKIPA